jgi:Zn-dependent protease
MQVIWNLLTNPSTRLHIGIGHRADIAQPPSVQLASVVIIYHRSVLPFMSDTEALFGLPRFLLLLSIALAFFNLIPVPPLDGGQLLFLVLESLGKAVPNEQQLTRIGSWMIVVTTIIVALLLASRVLNDTP